VTITDDTHLMRMADLEARQPHTGGSGHRLAPHRLAPCRRGTDRPIHHKEDWKAQALADIARVLAATDPAHAERGLGRLQQWMRWEDGPIRARAAGCGAQLLRRAARKSVPWRPPPCAAALRRAAVAWCGGFRAGALRRFLLCAQLSRHAACAGTRGALRAPLRAVEKFSQEGLERQGWRAGLRQVPAGAPGRCHRQRRCHRR
jgi:hypothetical protein